MYSGDLQALKQSINKLNMTLVQAGSGGLYEWAVVQELRRMCALIFKQFAGEGVEAVEATFRDEEAEDSLQS